MGLKRDKKRGDKPRSTQPAADTSESSTEASSREGGSREGDSHESTALVSETPPSADELAGAASAEPGAAPEGSGDADRRDASDTDSEDASTRSLDGGPESDDSEPPPPPSGSARGKRSTELSTKVAASIGIAAAMALAVVLNILAVRHFKRWDLTTGGLFTLSDGTTQTLHGLSEPVTIVVLLSNGDPLQVSVEQILDAYGAETGQLKIQYIDPDRKPAEFIAAQQKYDLSAGRSEDGRTVADTAIVVVRGEKHHFITSQDLVAVEDADDMRARPRLEQAITGGIRSVLDESRPKVCVTSGHGEHGLDEGGDTGLAYLRERLVKNNYEVTSVFGEALTEKDPLAGCNLVILAAPTQPVPKADAAAIQRFIENGGSALLVTGPVPSEDANDYVDLGVGDLFALGGVKLEKAVVFETDPVHRFSRGYGEVFYPDIEAHAITAGLEREQDKGTRVVLNVSGALKDLGNGTTPMPLLKSTDKAVGLGDFFGWARDPKVPEKGDKDIGGPFVLAAAAERPKRSPSDDRGPRVVVIGCPTMLFGVNWREPHLRGNELFVESAISWLGSHRAFLDIPNRPTVSIGVRVTESSLQKIFVFVVGIIPALTGAIGLYIFLNRRKSPVAKKKSAEKVTGAKA